MSVNRKPALMAGFAYQRARYPATHICKKVPQYGSVEGEARRELEKQRSQLCAEGCHFFEESIEKNIDVAETPIVSDQSRYLHGESEFLRHRCFPTLIGLPFVRATEGRVDLCGREAPCIPLQCRPAFGEAISHSRRDRPAGCPDATPFQLPTLVLCHLRPAEPRSE